MGWMAPLRHLGAKLLVVRDHERNREPSMGEITTVGLDLAKNVFQVHGVDAEGMTVVRKQLRRAQVLVFFSRLRPVWSGWRRAQRRITGRGSCVRSAMRYG